MVNSAFVLDLDHTLVGDVTPLLRRYAFLRALRRWGLPGPCPDGALAACLANTPLLRPGVLDFMRRASVAGARLFVFTASERAWANALVRAIQKATGVKFAHPICARDSCHVRADGSIGKSIQALGKRRLSGATGRKGGGGGDGKIVVIDNSDVWDTANGANGAETEDDSVRFVRCPTYRYAPAIDVLEGVPAKTLRDARVADLVKRMASAKQCYDPNAYADPAKAACHRHRFLARNALLAVHQNEPHLKDAFFYAVSV